MMAPSAGDFYFWQQDLNYKLHKYLKTLKSQFCVVVYLFMKYLIQFNKTDTDSV